MEAQDLKKKNTLLNLINHKLYTDKIYWYAKDPYEAKTIFLMKKREGAELKHYNNSKGFLNIQMVWIIFIIILKNKI